MAPEILAGSNNYDIKADVYSFGILLWEIMSRNKPYVELNNFQIPLAVLERGLRPKMSKIPSNCSYRIRELMKQCWDKSRSKRPDFNQIVRVLEEEIEDLSS